MTFLCESTVAILVVSLAFAAGHMGFEEASVMQVTVSHDEYEVIAQADCASMAISRELDGWTFAVKRLCTSNGDSCESICESPALRQQDSQTSAREWSSIGAFHVYLDRPFTSQGNTCAPHMGLKVLQRASFETYTNCGPNFCCCYVPL